MSDGNNQVTIKADDIKRNLDFIDKYLMDNKVVIREQIEHTINLRLRKEVDRMWQEYMNYMRGRY